jgi:hypothetical protein
MRMWLCIFELRIDPPKRWDSDILSFCMEVWNIMFISANKYGSADMWQAYF